MIDDKMFKVDPITKKFHHAKGQTYHDGNVEDDGLRTCARTYDT